MSAHLELRLVLPVPCGVAELREALGRLGDGAELVNVALAGPDGVPVTVDDLLDVVLVAVAPAGGDPARMVSPPEVATVATTAPARSSGRAELARLVAEVPAGDGRSARQLAEDLAPLAGLAPSSARRYLGDLRADR